MNDLERNTKPVFNPRIDPEKRVAGEDYFRTVKDLKVMNSLGNKQTEKAFARTRFDNQASTNNCGAENMDEIEAISSLFGNNPRTRQYVDTSLDISEVIAKI